MSAKLLRAQIDSEFENIATVLSEIDKVVRPSGKKYSVAELAALSTYVHNIYNGIENTLKRGLVYLGGGVRNTPTWHKDLLEDARQAGLINHVLQQQLMEYLSFRHGYLPIQMTLWHVTEKEKRAGARFSILYHLTCYRPDNKFLS